MQQYPDGSFFLEQYDDEQTDATGSSHAGIASTVAGTFQYPSASMYSHIGLPLNSSTGSMGTFRVQSTVPAILDGKGSITLQDDQGDTAAASISKQDAQAFIRLCTDQDPSYAEIGQLRDKDKVWICKLWPKLAKKSNFLITHVLTQHPFGIDQSINEEPSRVELTERDVRAVTLEDRQVYLDQLDTNTRDRLANRKKIRASDKGWICSFCHGIGPTKKFSATRHVLLKHMCHDEEEDD